MNPTLKAPDLLQVVPYQGKEIHRGDVIVFRPPGSKGMVVHRVISVDAQGVRTRGDKNSELDLWILVLIASWDGWSGPNGERSSARYAGGSGAN